MKDAVVVPCIFQILIGGFGLGGLANPARFILGEWKAVRTEFISTAAIGLQNRNRG